MIRVTSAEFGNDSRRFEERALTEAVIVTRDGRDHAVMISIAEYRRLRRRDRRATATAIGRQDEGVSPSRRAATTLSDEARRQATRLRGAPEEQEALGFIESAMDWDDRVLSGATS